MNWKYFIPYDLAEDKTTSQDVYLLNPDNGESYWITVTGLGFFMDDAKDLFHPALFQQVMTHLEEEETYIQDTDVYVNTMDFNEKELLEWVQLWITEQGFEVDELEKGSTQEFRKANKAIDAFEQAFEQMVANYLQDQRMNDS